MQTLLDQIGLGLGGSALTVPPWQATKRYGTILADPPWHEAGTGKIIRGAQKHYPLLATSEILQMGDKIQRCVLSDCHLYLWVTNNFLKDGLNVLDAWGFEYISIITWLKTDGPGIGQYFRGVTEHVLFGRRGQPAYRGIRKRAQGLSGFSAPRPGGHSMKPNQIHRWAMVVSPGPYLELFARRPYPGWDIWGNGV